jgi:hypothetical protein
VLLWAKGLNAKDINKEMFPAYGGKCLSHEMVHNLGGKRFTDDEEVEMEVQKWLRQQSRDCYAVGFDALVKRWAVYQFWWRIYQAINVFSRFKYHMFYILYPSVTYLLTLPCT